MTHKKASYALALVAIVLAGLLWSTNVHATDSHTFSVPAVLKCNGPIQEDTAAYVRLVKYGDGKVVYRCTHGQ